MSLPDISLRYNGNRTPFSPSFVGVGGTHRKTQIALFVLRTFSTLVSFYRAMANQLGNRNILPSSNLNEALERSVHRFAVVNFIFSGFYLIVLCVRCSTLSTTCASEQVYFSDENNVRHMVASLSANDMENRHNQLYRTRARPTREPLGP